jgi:hypothetical protein
MTFIVYGVGAMALAAKLTQSGQPVAGIASGDHVRASRLEAMH